MIYVTKFLRAYKVEKAPPDHPGYSWLELLIGFELHGFGDEIADRESIEEECVESTGTQQ